MNIAKSTKAIIQCTRINLLIKFVHQQMHSIKLDKFLKFTLKIALTYSYMFRCTTIIRELSLEPS